jgi:spore germination protein GerM
VQLYFVGGERLVGVVRRARSPDLETAVRTLLDGPTDAEAAGGLRTAVPAGTELQQARVEGGTAWVDLSKPFADVSGENQVPAVAQLVFTATGVAGVERVTIAVDGTVIEVPRSDGTLTPGPLTRADFPDAAPA